MIQFVLNGEKRFLNYSISVMFDVFDKFGDIKNALELVEKNTQEGIDAVRWLAVRMANDGEFARREIGYDAQKLLSETDISDRMSPLQFSVLRQKVIDAISEGYNREIESKEEIDLGLLELEQKKTEIKA